MTWPAWLLPWANAFAGFTTASTLTSAKFRKPPDRCQDTVGTIGKRLWELGIELCKKRGNESPLELKVARMAEIRMRSLEQIVPCG